MKRVESKDTLEGPVHCVQLDWKGFPPSQASRALSSPGMATVVTRREPRQPNSHAPNILPGSIIRPNNRRLGRLNSSYKYSKTEASPSKLPAEIGP